MKIRNSLRSLKQRHRNCRVVKRRGKVYVINKVQRRFKARQADRYISIDELNNCNNFKDFRELAKRRLPRPIFDYIDGAPTMNLLTHEIQEFQLGFFNSECVKIGKRRGHVHNHFCKKFLCPCIALHSCSEAFITKEKSGS